MSNEPNPLPPDIEEVPPGSKGGPPTSDERMLAMLCHLGGLFTSVIVPLVIYVVKKDESPFIRDHGREALNFQISLILYSMAAVALMIIVIGFFLILALIVFEIVVIVMACLAANRGEPYSYPLCIRLIKD